VNPVLRASAAHVFVESLAAPELSADDEHHLRRVLRIGDCDVITVGDGVGGWVTALLRSDGLSVESEQLNDSEPRPAIVISAIPKGNRPEWIVQKLTEIGATSIGFMDCARNVVRWDTERGSRQVERFRRVAREAAMQSRRLWLPEIRDVVPFSAAATTEGCAIADPDGDRLTGDIDTLLVGPEGGFTGAELDLVARRVALSANVLRVETAAFAGAMLLTLRPECD
jgi:16S rRNA (uracil1498-N3)-methyltransferase